MGITLLLGGVWVVTLGGKPSPDDEEPKPAGPSTGPTRRPTLASQALGKYVPETIGEKLAADPPRDYQHGRRSTFVPGGNILAFSTAHKQRATMDVTMPAMEDTMASGGASSNSSYHQM